MVGRTSGGAECAHFLNEERQKCLWVDEGFCFLIQIGLVGRTAALGHEEEAVFVALGGVNVDLRGKVAAGVDLIVHIEGSVL